MLPVEGRPPKELAGLSLVCVVKFEVASAEEASAEDACGEASSSASSASSSSSAPVLEEPSASTGIFRACCSSASRPAASASLALPAALLGAARESASLQGQAEWLLCNWADDLNSSSSARRFVYAAVLFHSDEAGVEKLLGAAGCLRETCDFIGEDIEVVSCEPHSSPVEERFQTCSSLFLARARPELAALGLRRLPLSSAVHLCECGYCVVDGFADGDAVAPIQGAVRESVELWLQATCAELLHGSLASAFGLAGAADFRWFRPEPRKARDDIIAKVSLSDDSARRPPLGAVVSTLRDIREDLRRVVRLRGFTEVQLAWYPRESRGYARHYDAAADDGSSRQRRVTAIVYCNERWRPGDGGELQLWPHGLGGGTVTVEPTAGKLLLFLSGCTPHVVRPTHAARVAVTMWVS